MFDDMLAQAEITLLESKLTDSQVQVQAMAHALALLQQRVERLETVCAAQLSILAIQREYDALGARDDICLLKDYDNWAGFSPAEWTLLCRNAIDFAQVRDGTNVLEVGCGAGGFLEELHHYKKVTMTGVDLAPKLIAIAQSRLPGRYIAGDMTEMPFLAEASFDHVLAHGSFLYLPSVDHVRKAALECMRVAKPNATIYIGMLNARTAGSGHVHVDDAFWAAFAAEHNAQLRIVPQIQLFTKADGYDGFARDRYSLVLRLPS